MAVHIPTSTFTQAPPGSLTSQQLNVGPAVEQLTLQQEANALMGAIERSHELLDRLTSAPTQNQAGTPPIETPLSSAVRSTRQRVYALNERLENLIGFVGQI